MLGLLLFNLVGYMLLFQYFIDRSDSIVFDQINNNRYKPTDLVEIKIPANFKTIENWNEYAPISGQVKLSDTCYNFAYLKMTRDTMYLLCIPNHEKARLKNAKIIYAKQISDIPINEKSRLPLIKLSIFESDYHYPAMAFHGAIPADVVKILPDYAFLNIIKTSIGIPGQPPDGLNILS
jgi:hypothetical protein